MYRNFTNKKASVLRHQDNILNEGVQSDADVSGINDQTTGNVTTGEEDTQLTADAYAQSKGYESAEDYIKEGNVLLPPVTNKDIRQEKRYLNKYVRPGATKEQAIESFFSREMGTKDPGLELSDDEYQRYQTLGRRGFLRQQRLADQFAQSQEDGTVQPVKKVPLTEEEQAKAEALRERFQQNTPKRHTPRERKLQRILESEDILAAPNFYRRFLGDRLDMPRHTRRKKILEQLSSPFLGSLGSTLSLITDLPERSFARAGYNMERGAKGKGRAIGNIAGGAASIFGNMLSGFSAYNQGQSPFASSTYNASNILDAIGNKTFSIGGLDFKVVSDGEGGLTFTPAQGGEGVNIFTGPGSEVVESPELSTDRSEFFGEDGTLKEGYTRKYDEDGTADGFIYDSEGNRVYREMFINQAGGSTPVVKHQDLMTFNPPDFLNVTPGPFSTMDDAPSMRGKPMNPILPALDAERQEPYTGEIPTPEELGYLPPLSVDPTRGYYGMKVTGFRSPNPGETYFDYRTGYKAQLPEYSNFDVEIDESHKDYVYEEPSGLFQPLRPKPDMSLLGVEDPMTIDSIKPVTMEELGEPVIEFDESTLPQDNLDLKFEDLSLSAQQDPYMRQFYGIKDDEGTDDAGKDDATELTDLQKLAGYGKAVNTAANIFRPNDISTAAYKTGYTLGAYLDDKPFLGGLGTLAGLGKIGLASAREMKGTRSEAIATADERRRAAKRLRESYLAGNEKGRQDIALESYLQTSAYDPMATEFGQDGLMIGDDGGLNISNRGLLAYPDGVLVPSGNITMALDGLPSSVLAIPENDPITIMQNGYDYDFPNSDYVVEIPLNQALYG